MLCLQAERTSDPEVEHPVTPNPYDLEPGPILLIIQDEASGSATTMSVDVRYNSSTFLAQWNPSIKTLQNPRTLSLCRGRVFVNLQSQKRFKQNQIFSEGKSLQ